MCWRSDLVPSRVAESEQAFSTMTFIPLFPSVKNSASISDFPHRGVIRNLFHSQAFRPHQAKISIPQVAAVLFCLSPSPFSYLPCLFRFLAFQRFSFWRTPCSFQPHDWRPAAFGPSPDRGPLASSVHSMPLSCRCHSSPFKTQGMPHPNSKRNSGFVPPVREARLTPSNTKKPT